MIMIDAVVSLINVFSLICLYMRNHVTCPFMDQSLVLPFDKFFSFASINYEYIYNFDNCAEG